MAAYRWVRRSGLLSTGFGRQLFEFAYDAYKERIEAAEVDSLRGFVRPGSTVVDVGANVGFFSERFAGWVGAAGRVIAIEAESVNVEQLRHRLSRRGYAGRVEVVEAAAAEREGELRLTINPDHPGDHRLGEDGVQVPAVTVDGLIASRGWPEVSLVKIDVQGAEDRVLRGAAETLSRIRPPLFIEIDGAALRQQGSDLDTMLARLTALGYAPNVVEGGGWPRPISVDEVIAMGAADGSYFDILFLALPTCGTA